MFLALFFVLKDFTAPTGTSGNFSFLFSFVDDIRQNINNSSDKVPKNWPAAGWILLVFYIGSQMLSTVTMMTSPNPQQKIIFLLMPLFFAPFIINFPVGVMLYWITTNLWSLFQYLLVVRFSRTDVEVVLPADSKGRKKVVTPKGAKSTAKPGEKKSPGGQDSRSSGGQQAQARRNKRRR